MGCVRSGRHRGGQGESGDEREEEEGEEGSGGGGEKVHDGGSLIECGVVSGVAAG